MQRTQLLVAFLLGVCVALFAALVATAGRGLPEARAQGSGNAEWLAVPGNSGQGQGQKEVLWVLDAKGSRLVCYQLNAGRLQLVFVRNIVYDTKFEEFPTPSTQMPAVKDVYEKIKEKH